MLGEEQVFLEFGKLVGAEQRLVAHQQRHLHLGVAVFARMQVEHELAKRAFQPRDLPGENREARARKLRRTLEIHLAERLADLEMLARPGGFRLRLADPAHLDIVALVPAERNVVERDVGQDGQRVAHGAVEIALGRLAVLDEGLDVGDFGLQPLGKLHVAGAHGIADLLGRGVAAFLLFLEGDEMGAARLVMADDFLDLCGSLVLRPAALFESSGKRFGLFANPFDVEHWQSVPVYVR